MIGTYACVKAIFKPYIYCENTMAVFKMINRINPELPSNKILSHDVDDEVGLCAANILSNLNNPNYSALYLGVSTIDYKPYHLYILKDGGCYIIPKIDRIISIDSKLIPYSDEKIKLVIGEDTRVELYFNKDKCKLSNFEVYINGSKFENFVDILASYLYYICKHDTENYEDVEVGESEKVQSKFYRFKLGNDICDVKITDVYFDMIKVGKHDYGSGYVFMIMKLDVEGDEIAKNIASQHIMVYISKDVNSETYLLSVSFMGKTYVSFYNGDEFNTYLFDTGIMLAYNKSLVLLGDRYIILKPDYNRFDFEISCSYYLIDSYDFNTMVEECYIDSHLNKKYFGVWVFDLPQHIVKNNPYKILFWNYTLADDHFSYRIYNDIYKYKCNKMYIHYLPPATLKLIKH